MTVEPVGATEPPSPVPGRGARRGRARLTEGPVGRTLLALALPMVVGLFAVIGFNLADTYFVAQLGTHPLAAMGFTFPVTMVVTSLALGLGTGTTSALSRAIGEGDRHRVQALATSALTLALTTALLVAIAGLATLGPVFSLLGATRDLLPLVRAYMVLWYLGIPFIVVPMVGNAAIRATGDTRSPSAIMITAAGINLVLDPLLIYGLLGCPRLELRGAAIATVVARATTLAVSLSILHFREHLLTRPCWAETVAGWRQILYVAVPAAATNLLAPIAFGIITRLAAHFGPEAVAAVGTANRIEALSLIAIMALGASLVPFLGQNWGAGKLDRIHHAQGLAYRFAHAWGGLTWLIFLVAAPMIAALFTDDPEVSHHIVQYLWIVPASYGLHGTTLLTAALFNATNRPLVAAAIQTTRMFVLYVPGAMLGAHLAGLAGMFTGLCLANGAAGLGAWLVAWRSARRSVP
jgi:putative MATE family efflux protein